MKAFVRRCRIAVLCAAPLAAAPGQTPLPSRAIVAKQVDSIIREVVDLNTTASIAVAVVRGRDTIVHSVYGFADLESKRPATVNTVYRIGSLTKQFTAAMIMRLAEQGKLSVSDTLGRFLPTVNPAWRSRPLSQILNHTSGIHNYTDVAAWRSTWEKDLTPEQIVAFVEKDSLDFPPGTKWSYSNTGYVLLGMVIEKVTGRPYARVMEDSLFKPLGMTRSSYCPTVPDAQNDHALGYEGTRPAPKLSMTHPYSAGALCSTVGDFIRWQRALATGKVVAPASYAAMTTPIPLPSGAAQTYGFGLGALRAGTRMMHAHSGGVHGYQTYAAYFPDDTLQMVVFTNSAGPEFGRLSTAIRQAILGMPITARRQPPVVALTSADRERILGTYDLQLPGRVLPLRVFVQGDALMMQGEGQDPNPLKHFGNLVFGADFDPALRVTFVTENGTITKLRLQQGGGSFEGPRRR